MTYIIIEGDESSTTVIEKADNFAIIVDDVRETVVLPVAAQAMTLGAAASIAIQNGEGPSGRPGTPGRPGEQGPPGLNAGDVIDLDPGDLTLLFDNALL